MSKSIFFWDNCCLGLWPLCAQRTSNSLMLFGKSGNSNIPASGNVATDLFLAWSVFLYYTVLIPTELAPAPVSCVCVSGPHHVTPSLHHAFLFSFCSYPQWFHDTWGRAIRPWSHRSLTSLVCPILSVILYIVWLQLCHTQDCALDLDTLKMASCSTLLSCEGFLCCVL